MLALVFYYPYLRLSRRYYGEDSELRDIPWPFEVEEFQNYIFKAKLNPSVTANDFFCSICLVHFNDHDSVTPLHCDERHFFHTSCIIEWLSKKNLCPLCKIPISIFGLNKMKKKHILG